MALTDFSNVIVTTGAGKVIFAGSSEGGGAPPVEPGVLTVTIVSPAEGATLPVGVATTITGTVSREGATVAVTSLGAATVIGTNWTRAWTPGVAGPVELEATATEGSDNASDTNNVTITAGTALTVTITSPADAANITLDEDILITGTVSRAGATVNITGVGAATVVGTDWSRVLSPDELGALAIEATASEGGDNASDTNNVTVLPGDLVLWKDMQDPAGFTESAGVITGIVNKVSGVTFNTAGTVLPGYSATGFNGGLPCATYNGTSNAIGCTEAAVVAIENQSNTLVLALDITTVDLLQTICLFSNAASSTNYVYYATSDVGTGRYRVARDGPLTSVNSFDGAGTAVTTPQILAFRTTRVSATSYTYEIILNGVLFGTGSHAATEDINSTMFSFGCRWLNSFTQYYAGNIAEAKLYSTLLSDEFLSGVIVKMGEKQDIAVSVFAGAAEGSEVFDTLPYQDEGDLSTDFLFFDGFDPDYLVEGASP